MMIWDIETDPMNPKLLGKFECKGMAGVHRFFYNGGRYVYCVGNKPGFLNFYFKNHRYSRSNPSSRSRFMVGR